MGSTNRTIPRPSAAGGGQGRPVRRWLRRVVFYVDKLVMWTNAEPSRQDQTALVQECRHVHVNASEPAWWDETMVCRLDIKGPTGERLSFFSSSIAPEAACTSVQLHLQVAPTDFAAHWNAAQAIAGPQLAIAANSPPLAVVIVGIGSSRSRAPGPPLPGVPPTGSSPGAAPPNRDHGE